MKAAIALLLVALLILPTLWKVRIMMERGRRHSPPPAATPQGEEEPGGSPPPR